MTEPPATARNGSSGAWAERAVLLIVLAVAAWMRLDGVGFGLPALNDPDEPIFVMTALEMLRNQSLNPGWFGHPGTTTIYALALISLGVAFGGIATGRFADADAFVGAVYADPGILFLPGRLFIVACGIACVLLTYRIGRKLYGARTGLLAAGFLAVNAVHIEYSQIIRTDVHASLFMLLGTLSAIAIEREGRRRDYLLAGAWVGLACATKWPAAVIALGPLCAGLSRLPRDRQALHRVALFCGVSAATLFLVSPYLLIDHASLIRNLAGEARPVHPGATGGGFFANLGWYAMHPLLASFGAGGLLLALGGTAIGLRSRTWRVAVLPGFAFFLLIICAQALLWERWVVPLLPFLALAAAMALVRAADAVRARIGRRMRGLDAAAALLLAVPMVQTARIEAAERTNDTRQMAAAWVRANVPPGRTILIEDAAFDLLQGGWRFLFPLGAAGCVDVHELLTGRIAYGEVEPLRVGRAVIDAGHLDPARIAACRPDVMVLSHYERYRSEPGPFAAELANYRNLTRGSRLRAVFRPTRGTSTGPVVYVFERARPGATADPPKQAALRGRPSA